jgi:hypothetical protein
LIPGEATDDDFLPPSAEQGDAELIVNAADPESLKRVRRRKLSEAEKVRDWWRQALSTATGRAVIWGLLNETGLFATTFACGPNGFPQPDATWHALGAKSVGERLYRTLMIHDRDALFRMHDEHDPAFAQPKKRRSSQPGE